MQLTNNARNKILSILLDIASCQLICITEYKENQKQRYLYGDDSYKIIEQNHSNQEFITEYTISTFGYVFTLSLGANKRLQIDCLKTSDAAQRDKDSGNARKELTRIEPQSRSTELVLYYAEKAPEYLSTLLAERSQNNKNKIQKDTSIGTQAKLFFKAIIASIEINYLVEHYLKLTNDSLTNLKSRSALQRFIDEKIEHADMALCMVHCIDFQHVNRKFGQAKGDMVLQEIAELLTQHTRAEDTAGRFGGALFAVAIEVNSIEDASVLGTKLQQVLNNRHYLKNALRLNFNIGIAFVSHKEAQIDKNNSANLLISRAEQALKAAQKSLKPSVVQWEADKFRLDEQDFNYLGGIFTPDNVTNYRNMLLLWDISSIIADEHSFDRLLKSVIERLAFTFEFTYSGVVSLADKNQANLHPDNKLANGLSYRLVDASEIQDLEWHNYEYKELTLQAAKQAQKESTHVQIEENKLSVLAVPMGTDTLESFFIVGEKERLSLSHDTILLFAGFSRQLGKALKRNQLEDELNKNLEQQNAKLERELLELKAGLQSSALVYRSDIMQKLITQTQRAAQTDTTVLITGESGTGKEKLINAIHNFSPRIDKPMVIVDCGSIPETLIESELFGHIKGAFTGAQNNSIGKIQAAQNGILVLDEVGELPLSMQPKLLRFVQEKHFTPIGSTKSISVDVKIVAVTNRNLAQEVENGKFRKDLYYRLNVVSLHNPPLRERIEDLELLSQHFLSKFISQFNMPKKHLSEKTMEKMKQYDWPGNIRELENRLMQASLLSNDYEIEFSDLNISLMAESSGISFNQNEHKPSTILVPENDSPKHASTAPQLNSESAHIDAENWQESFVYSLNQLVTDLNMNELIDLAIGDLIEAKLLEIAQSTCQSHSKTAVLLQMPISTARRKLKKPSPDYTVIEEKRQWQVLVSVFEKIVDKSLQIHKPVEQVRNLTAKTLLMAFSHNMALASQLMGVSEPTMYKFKRELKL